VGLPEPPKNTHPDIIPPLPPQSHIYTIEDITFINNISDISIRDMIKNGYEAVCLCNAWDWLKNFNEESFQTSKNPIIWVITGQMETLGFYGHSGYSFGYTMRALELLAKHGKDKFLEKYAN
jgi:hypothetical protein